MAASLVLQAGNVLFFILLQVMMDSKVLNALDLEEPTVSSNSRSAFFETRKNTRLVGHVVKWVEVNSLMSCSQLCASKAWCTSTNFVAHSNNDCKGACELNKHDPTTMTDEFGKLQTQPGVTFSLLLKVCFRQSHF